MKSRSSLAVLAFSLFIASSPTRGGEGAVSSASAESLSAATHVEGVTEMLPVGLSSEERFPKQETRAYALPASVMQAIGVSGDETWRLRRWSEDETGLRHYRMKQFIGGIEVVGGDMMRLLPLATRNGSG